MIPERKDLNGKYVSFHHDVITPSGEAISDKEEDHEIDQPRGHDDPCLIDFNFDFTQFECGVGAEYAARCSLQRLFTDSQHSQDQQMKLDSLMMFGWLGSLDSIDEVFEKSSWAGFFLLNVMEKYGPSDLHLDDSNFLMNFGDALSSLQFQSSLEISQTSALLTTAGQ
jgi:hypothetical protein